MNLEKYSFGMGDRFGNEGTAQLQAIQEINNLPPEAAKVELLRSPSCEFRQRRADGTIRDVDVFSNKIECTGRYFLYPTIIN